MNLCRSAETVNSMKRAAVSTKLANHKLLVNYVELAYINCEINFFPEQIDLVKQISTRVR